MQAEPLPTPGPREPRPSAWAVRGPALPCQPRHHLRRSSSGRPLGRSHSPELRASRKRCSCRLRRGGCPPTPGRSADAPLGAEVELQLAGRFTPQRPRCDALGEALELPRGHSGGRAGLRAFPAGWNVVDCGQPSASSSTTLIRLPRCRRCRSARAAGTGGWRRPCRRLWVGGGADVQKRPMMAASPASVAALSSSLTRILARGPPDYSRRDRAARSLRKRPWDDLLCIADRREAIAAAFERARAEISWLAGKGHEQSIIMSDGSRAWDERAEAVHALRSMGYLDEDAASGCGRRLEPRADAILPIQRSSCSPVVFCLLWFALPLGVGALARALSTPAASPDGHEVEFRPARRLCS